MLVIFYLFSGLFFNSYNLVAQNTSMSSLFSSIVNLLGFLVPVLTMRLMSEEKKQRTDQLLLTSPVSLPGLVLGKLLSCYIAVSYTHLGAAPALRGPSPPAWRRDTAHTARPACRCCCPPQAGNLQAPRPHPCFWPAARF